MADLKISELGAASAVNNTDFIPMTSAGVTVKATAQQLKDYMGVGNLADLTTDTKTSAVAAINEVDAHADTAQSKADIVQSQLNAATQSIAQNTTDIATNAASISALNTGLATKIGTYETQQDNRILNIVHNINSDEIIAYDEKLAAWFPIWSKPKLAGQNFFTPASNVEITYQAVFAYGNIHIALLNLRLLTQFADTALVATSSDAAPIHTSYWTCRDGLNHLATFAFNPDRRLKCWGANPASKGNLYPIQLTYFV